MYACFSMCFADQVGVSDKERVLQRKLNHIAEVADTSSLNGLNYVLQGAHALCNF